MSRRTLRRLGLGLIALAVVAAGGYSLYWHRLAATVRNAIPAWAAARQAEGWAVSHGSVTVGGFPFDLRVAVPAPRIETPDGVAWSAPDLAAVISPLAPNRIRVQPAGRQELLVPVAGRYRAFRLEAGAARGVLNLAARGAEALTLHLEQVAAWEGGKGRDEHVVRMAVLDVALDLPRHQAPAEHTTTTAALSAAARDVDLPAVAATALGNRIAELGLKARLQGALSADVSLTEALARWRDVGGTVEIERLAVRWDPLDLEIDGTLALDGGLQPLAAMTGKIRGYAEAVDSFVRSGLVRPEDGRSVKLVLAIMGRVPTNGGAPVITVPLTVQDQKFLVGPVALMTLPRILWPSTEIVLPEAAGAGGSSTPDGRR